MYGRNIVPEGAVQAPEVLRKVAGRYAPVRWTPVGILLALAAGVVVAGVLLRRRRRGEWLWAAWRRWR